MNKVMEHKVNRKDTTTRLNLNFGKISPCNSRGFFMQKQKHKVIRKGRRWIVDNANAVGHMQKGLRPACRCYPVTGEIGHRRSVYVRSEEKSSVCVENTTDRTKRIDHDFLRSFAPILRCRHEPPARENITISMKTKSHAFNLSL